MATVNLGRFTVNETSYRRARELQASRPSTGEGKTANDVLNILRDIKPGWVVNTHGGNWQAGSRNLQIGQGILEKMANDPDAFFEYKAFILDLEYAAEEIEAWMAENPDAPLEFSFNLALEEGAKAVATIRTLLGGITQTTFEFSSDRLSWSDMIREKLDALKEGRTEEPDGSKSWAS